MPKGAGSIPCAAKVMYCKIFCVQSINTRCSQPYIRRGFDMNILKQFDGKINGALQTFDRMIARYAAGWAICLSEYDAGTTKERFLGYPENTLLRRFPLVAMWSWTISGHTIVKAYTGYFRACFDSA